MTTLEVAALLEEIDLMWPGAPAPNDSERQIRLWHDWLGRYDYQAARLALRRFGGQQAKPPSCAQLLGELRQRTGEKLPGPDEVLAEFSRVSRRHSSRELVQPEWWSRPEVAAFAMSGAYRDWGESPDATANEYLAASQAASQAALRRRWEAFAGDCDRVGLEAAYSRVRLAAAPRPAGELEPVSAALEASP